MSVLRLLLLGFSFGAIANAAIFAIRSTVGMPESAMILILMSAAIAGGALILGVGVTLQIEGILKRVISDAE